MLHHRFLIVLLVLAGLTIPAVGEARPPACHHFHSYPQHKATLKWRLKKGKTFFQTMTTTTFQQMTVMGFDIKQEQIQTFYFSLDPRRRNQTRQESHQAENRRRQDEHQRRR